jgi:hypothetical protein
MLQMPEIPALVLVDLYNQLIATSYMWGLTCQVETNLPTDSGQYKLFGTVNIGLCICTQK